MISTKASSLGWVAVMFLLVGGTDTAVGEGAQAGLDEQSIGNEPYQISAFSCLSESGQVVHGAYIVQPRTNRLYLTQDANAPILLGVLEGAGPRTDAKQTVELSGDNPLDFQIAVELENNTRLENAIHDLEERIRLSGESRGGDQLLDGQQENLRKLRLAHEQSSFMLMALRIVGRDDADAAYKSIVGGAIAEIRRLEANQIREVLNTERRDKTSPPRTPSSSPQQAPVQAEDSR